MKNVSGGCCYTFIFVIANVYGKVVCGMSYPARGKHQPFPKPFTHVYCTNSGFRKREAHKEWSMVIREKAAPVTGATLRTTGPVPADSRH